jgi:uncharacterized BrkB/YihY/UPF0761 family membrane protein
MNIQWLGRLTLKELATRTWRETNADKILGHAAELAYYFLLALFPMLIFLTSLVGFLPDLQEEIFKALAKFVPGDAMRLVSDTSFRRDSTPQRRPDFVRRVGRALGGFRRRGGGYGNAQRGL